MVMKANKNQYSRLKKCRSCHNDVSIHSDICPNCGDKNPTNSFTGCGCLFYILLILFVVAPLILSLWSYIAALLNIKNS